MNNNNNMKQWGSLVLPLVLVVVVIVGAELKVNKRASVCFDKVGCFSNDAPFNGAQRPVSVLPQSPDKILAKFSLYTRESKTSPQTLDARHPENAASVWTHFQKRPTQFIVHGFLDSPGLSSWLKDMKDQLLIHGDYNVVIVDWSSGNLPPYDQATANTRVVGVQIAAVINQLIKSSGNTAASFHLIGHSLGAHVCGYAGEKVAGLGRITGLDPAGPYYENTDKTVRLDPTDAVFVDNIHTDAKNLLQLGFGMKEQVGHSDFYPNLGHDQPGCTRDPITNVIQNGLIQGVEEEAACNHLRSIKFFTESINSQCPFMGFPCASEDDFNKNLCHSCTSSGCAPMGFHSNQHIPPSGRQAKYYLTTGDHAPFCRYHLDITLKISSGRGSDEKGTVSVVVNGDKGNSGKIPLASDAVTYSPGRAYKYYVMVPSEVGSVQSVTLSWSHPASLSDLLGNHHPIYLDEVDVFKEEAGVDVHLCSGAQGIDSGKSITVSSRC